MPFFQGDIFSAYEVPRPKPFPDLFLHAAMKLQTPPENCLVIKDSISGIKAALAAGMSVTGYDPNETGFLNIDPKVRIVSSMDAIDFN